jgi:hypothetical protein
MHGAQGCSATQSPVGSGPAKLRPPLTRCCCMTCLRHAAECTIRASARYRETVSCLGVTPLAAVDACEPSCAWLAVRRSDPDRGTRP